jgi:2-oxoglutarate dehydrogenase E1 component
MQDVSIFHGPNAGYVLDLYEQYCENPDAVDAATRAFFEEWLAQFDSADELAEAISGALNGDADATDLTEAAEFAAAPPAPQQAAAPEPPAPERPAPERPAPTNGKAAHPAPQQAAAPATPPQPAPVAAPTADQPFDLPQVVNAARLVRFIREIGHLAARIDPLGSDPPGDPGLELEPQGLTAELLQSMPPSVVMSALAEGTSNALEAVDRLRQVYSGTIGYDDEHVQSDEERQWLRDAAESGRFFAALDAERERDLLERLTEVEAFERFLHQTFLGQKRFSIEGTDMLVPMIDAIIRDAASADTHEVVIGMAHRGRLNVLAHNLGKPYSAILAEFQGPNHYNRGTYMGWTGDVKYHLGARKAYREGDVFEMPLTLVPNPSHLEFVNPVVEGRARAAQERHDQSGAPQIDPAASLPILIHGDAAFPGQGVVAETLNMSQLAGYTTGGTIHIIINNQIGFTTYAGESRSTLYAGDMAKGFDIPVVHVNADDPRACIAVARMAWAYREQFGKDFLIDLVGYRRWGHNEGDEPSYTQPEMYRIISEHPTVRELWGRDLVRRGVMTEAQVEKVNERAYNRLRRALHEVEKRGRIDATMAVSVSSLLHRPLTDPQPLSVEQLSEINEALIRLPDGFQMNPKLERALQRRYTLAEPTEPSIDWAHAEALAFASILVEGVPIRLTGQDTERGTFSQRHLVIHDRETGQRHVPLQTLPQARASFAVYNSPLSENATLGFEYGYSSHAPDTLVLWEAQFGDFANGAQVIVDQFIVSGNAKWGQQSAMVLLLPHGYEGQGPEHSNARPERFLQLAADNNIRVVNCTTAAQYFHLLRRQAMLLQSDPRPLIVMTPKSLLRHPMAASSPEDLAHGRFLPVLVPDVRREEADDVTRLILCSGKVYVDLMSKYRDGDTPRLPAGIAAARVEELYPFPQSELEALVGWYRNVREVIWLQEEPANMGAWNYIRPRLREVINSRRPSRHIGLYYCGRLESASTAEGTHNQHAIEQQRILRDVVHGVFERHPAYN